VFETIGIHRKERFYHGRWNTSKACRLTARLPLA
jgi:hypothetical protein